VREVFYPFTQKNGENGVVYRADTEDGYFSQCETLTGGYPAECLHHPSCEGCPPGRWKPSWRSSRFMPRWASRINLEITGVRVERLQTITEADAVAEGVIQVTQRGGGAVQGSAVNGYKHLWQFLNAKRPGCAWNDDPWVFVIEFKRVNL
jgi:hypothetical protein